MHRIGCTDPRTQFLGVHDPGGRVHAQNVSDNLPRVDVVLHAKFNS